VSGRQYTVNDLYDLDFMALAGIAEAALAFLSRVDEIEASSEYLGLFALHVARGGGWPKDLNWQQERERLRGALTGECG
jgi:hypothetical protein